MTEPTQHNNDIKATDSPAHNAPGTDSPVLNASDSVSPAGNDDKGGGNKPASSKGRWALRVYKIVRGVVLSLLALAVVLPVGLYVTLSTPWAQEKIRTVAQDELSKLLGTEVSIGHVTVYPFNRLDITDVKANDDYGQQAVAISEVDARFELMHFLRTGNIVIDYAAIDGLHARLYKQTPDSPLNIANIIDKLKSKDEKKEEKPFDLAISTVIIRNSSATFDILSAPRREGRFDPNHIAVSNLDVMAGLPRLSDKRIAVVLEKLSFDEQSGFRLDDLMARVEYTKTGIKVHSLDIELPNSHLRIADLDLPYDTPDQLKAYGRTLPVELCVADGSVVTPSDLKAFVPALDGFDAPVAMTLDVAGTLKEVRLKELRLSSDDRAQNITARISGTVHSLDSIAALRVDSLDLHLDTDAPTVSRLLALAPAKTAGQLKRPLSVARTLVVDARLSGTAQAIDGTLKAVTGAGTVTADGNLRRVADKVYSIDATADIDNVELGAFMGREDLGAVTASVNVTGTTGKTPAGEVDVVIDRLIFRGNDLGNISLTANADADRQFAGNIDMDNALGKMALAISGCYGSDRPALTVNGVIAEFDPTMLGVKSKYDGYKLSTLVDVDLAGKVREWINGHAELKDIRFHDYAGTGKPLDINKIRLEANNTERPNTVTLESDFLNGHLDGRISIATLVPQLRDMAATVMPDLLGDHHYDGPDDSLLPANEFTYEFTVSNAEKLSDFLNLPIQIIYPVTIDGGVDYSDGTAYATIDAPYLQQKDKIIDNTLVGLSLNAADGRAGIYATTNMPTQKGPMAIVAAMSAADNRVDTKVNWAIERQKAIGGDLSLSTLLGRDDEGRLTAEVNINPGDINFGDAVWSIAPSRITWADKSLSVSDFAMTSGQQSIQLDGQADQTDESLLQLKLRNITLVKIFETLDINNALIGGTATGTFNVRSLFTPQPDIVCNDLHVDSISYNYCVLGDAELQAHWDNERQSVFLDADVTEPGGLHSRIWGDIIPAGERLDIHIDANHARVGFMKPFMAAFAADVDGYASGTAHLYGTFKNIDLTGDLHAEKLGLKIAFTNTWYYCEDETVHMAPGLIDLRDVTVRDQYGHTAKLNGWVRHQYFHLPSFDFRITDADNLLCYDTTSKISPDWYGRIFGDGTATINGHPGVVNIGAVMRTAPGSTFTFVLSDLEEADDYTFIQFRDPTKGVVTDSIIEADPLPRAVREYRDRQLAKALAKDVPSDYIMDISVDITQDAKMVIVMDPVGGDEIKATGSGNLRMLYQSKGNDLKMWGDYTIEQGKYNFTLQDIVVKDFTIREGSMIKFTGDPYAAELDLSAVYTANANLSDLDESFLNDRDLNRTTVPVNAILMAKGDMRQPIVSFDLEFPTLTSDVYRKVRSIISTEEMMSRQIIYLLALNRFYAPDYMSTTKGNELFSVASSTLSSQLSSMLGKLSDNFSLTPNVRSDRGDFSDVEVDVGMSGTLLNNRLRFNGNFGYRDDAMSTNQFIGDVDVEYWLNRKGTWRLKAYNRFNDQNYYLRTAQTTQGVGIMFKRDFDKMFNFMKRKNRTAPADSTATGPERAPADSTAVKGTHIPATPQGNDSTAIK